MVREEHGVECKDKPKELVGPDSHATLGILAYDKCYPALSHVGATHHKRLT